MIRLELKDYCHDCVGFEADVESPTIYLGRNGIPVEQTDTIVRCKHRKRCRHVVEYIMEGYKVKENASRNT